jgi:hypothetical protein
MQVGDKSKEWVRSDAVHDHGEHIYGTVVYIHPLRRFYTVEFDLHGRKYRESYPFQYRKGEK